MGCCRRAHRRAGVRHCCAAPVHQRQRRAVVDCELRVQDLDRLRVWTPPVMPRIIRGHRADRRRPRRHLPPARPRRGRSPARRRRAQGGPACPRGPHTGTADRHPALIATGLLAVGATVAETDPDRARACLRESLELSTALGYQSWLDHIWAAGIALLVNDRTATLELGRDGIHVLQWAGDRLRMGFVLHIIAGALAATWPEAAAIIQGAAEAYMVESPNFAQLISLTVTEALGEEGARELRARGADMDWDQAVAYTLAQTTQALNELQSETQP
jgi:hypothetical protein